MRIGIYGGSFNPPHRGHTGLIYSASRQLELDRVIVVPANSPPHKRLSENSPSAEHRLEMTKIAFKGISNAEVSDIEIKRQGESYTIDTVREIKNLYPDDELYLIMGTDMYLSFDKWKDSEELMTLTIPAVAGRGGYRADETMQRAEELRGRGYATEVIENTAVEISSTKLRREFSQRLKNWHIDDDVYSYIIENGLYGVKPDFDWLRCRAYEMLDKKRIPHVAGCEATAVQLAGRWGADVDSAREAAILHDITKKLEAEEQLSMCREYDVETDELERQAWKMLHAKTAAAYASAHFCVSEDVKNAIRWHTTGCADMALLDKIIYMADYIEPNRTFRGVEEMRILAFLELDRALMMGAQMSIEDLESRGILPYKTTLEALECLRKR